MLKQFFISLFAIGRVLAIVDNSNEVIHAFYNVFAEGPYYRAIVSEQLHVLFSSGLYEKISKLHYVTIGQDSASYVVLNDTKFEKLGSFSNGTEVETLMLLYKFCKKQEKRKKIKVLYFHNKGSFHPSEKNAEFRRALDCFILNKNCIKALGNLYQYLTYSATSNTHISI